MYIMGKRSTWAINRDSVIEDMKSTCTLLLLLAVTTAIPVKEANKNNVNKRMSITNRIVGGLIATPHQFPYQVLIRMTNIRDGDIAYDSWCGGSLISDQVVLTAAHCLVKTVAATIYLGAHSRDAIEEPDRVTISVSRENMIIHETFNIDLYEDDIALIMLKEKVELNENIRTVNLPIKGQSNIEGRMAVTSGWGRTGDYKPASDLLRYAQRKIFKNDYCQRFYGALAESQICVDGYQKSICQGDSGGPLVIEESDGSKVLVGLTSFGRSDGCERGVPTVFTRVSSYLDWISRNSGISFIN